MNSTSIRNILVPVDLSETSLNAMETAVALTKRHDAALHLFYVNEKQPGYNDVMLGSFASSVVSSDVLFAIAAAIRHHHEIIPNVIEVVGNVTDCIVKASLQLSADLIVMGSHGASGYREYFVGSNSYNVIKYTTCPVLIIPPGRKITSFHNILFPVRPVSGALIDYGSTDRFFAPKATVDVMGFAFRGDGDTNLLEKLVNETKQNGNWLDIKANAYWGELPNIPDAVLLRAQNTKTDLIVLTSLLDSVSKTAYIGPHAQKIIHMAKVPVLSMKKVSVFSSAYVER